MVKEVSGFIVGPMWNEFMQYALTKIPVETFTSPQVDESNLKPIMQGIWQNPGSDGALHEILYWVNPSDPLGPAPTDPASDPQYEHWDYGVKLWGEQHGYQ